MTDSPEMRSRIEERDLDDEPLIIIARRIREVLLKDGSIERALADGHITTMQLMKLLNAISGARRAVGFVHPSSLDEEHEQGRITKQVGIFIPSKLT